VHKTKRINQTFLIKLIW